MGRLLRIAALVAALVSGSAVVVSGATALAAGHRRQVWVTDCLHERYKPKTIVLACGDGSNGLIDLKWSHWSTRGATASGINAYNTCTPSCAAGHIKKVAANVSLSKPIACRRQKHRVFKRLVLTFPHRQGRNRTQTFSLGCPIA